MGLSDNEKAAIEIYKHYGNIRFIMLPMFFTAMSAVIIGYWKLSTTTTPDTSLLLWVSISGVAISLLFVIYEISLSKFLYTSSNLLPSNMDDLKHNDWKGIVTYVTLFLYGVPAIFWATQFYKNCCL